MSHMRGYSSDMIRELQKRTPKCWKWVDWVLSSSCDKPALKKEVVLTLLGKALPNKVEQDINVRYRDETFFRHSEAELEAEEGKILKRFEARAGVTSN